MAELLYQGHGSYRFITNEGQVIYVDPFAGEGYSLPADLVLITHEHYDHNHLELIILKPKAAVIRSHQALEHGVHQSFDLDGIKITSTPAENKNHSPNECVGFIVEFDSLKIYCAGDTSYIPYMKDVLSKMNLDYALLPGDGIYNMGPEEAARCADVIKAKHAIPIHLCPGELYSEEKASQFLTSFKLLVRPGQTIVL